MLVRHPRRGNLLRPARRQVSRAGQPGHAGLRLPAPRPLLPVRADPALPARARRRARHRQGARLLRRRHGRAPVHARAATGSYAVDGDGDGRRDLFNNWDDVLASVANYFVVHKWRARRAGRRPAARSSGRVHAERPRTTSSRRTRPWPGSPPGRALLHGPRRRRRRRGSWSSTATTAPEYWVAFHNFYVITRYNRSVMYALAVYQLGQAVGEARAPRRGRDRPLRLSCSGHELRGEPGAGPDAC